MKRILRGVAVFLSVAVLSLAAGAQAPAGKGSARDAVGTRLPVSVYYSLPADPARVFEGFLKEYQETHQYLDLQSKNFANPDELYKALTSGQQTPTLALMETSWLSHVASAAPLLSVETWMPKDTFLFNWSVKCNCYNPLWDASQVNGSMVALPYFFTTRALIYNSDLMSRAAVKNPPATWAQLTDAAQKMSDPTHSQFGFALSPSNAPRQTAMSLQVLAWQAGCDFITQGSAAEKALTFLHDLTSHQSVADPERDLGTASVGMYIGTVEDYLSLRARGVPVKTALLPGPDKNIRTGAMQAWTLGVFKSVPDNQLYKVQELAFWLLDFPQQLRWAEETPYLAAHVKVFDNPFYRQQRLADHNNLRVFLNSLGKAKAVDTAGSSGMQLEALGKRVPAVLRGEKAARDLMGGPLSANP